jgi:uncharacterized Zn-finger protein
VAEVAEKSKTSQGAIAVSHKDLPLACPRSENDLWNMHPRVYLPIEKTGEATCPYCGAHYILQD